MANELDEMTGPTNPTGNSTQKERPFFSDEKSVAAKKLNKTVLSRMGIFGSAAGPKASANDDPQAAQQQLIKAEKESKQMTSLLVTMVNVLSSIDGHLKNQLQSSAYIYSQQQRTSREVSIETIPAPEQQATPVASNDNNQAQEVSKTATIATAIALAGIGAMIASYSGIMGNIKNAFSMLTGAANQTKDLEAGGDEGAAPPANQPKKAPVASRRPAADVKSKPAAQQDLNIKYAQATPSLLNPNPSPPPPPPPANKPSDASTMPTRASLAKKPEKPPIDWAAFNKTSSLLAKPMAKPTTTSPFGPSILSNDPKVRAEAFKNLSAKKTAGSSPGQINPTDVLNFTARTGSLDHFNKMKPEARKAILAAAQEYQQVYGEKLTINSAFRSYDEQKYLYENPQGYIVAKPGTSPHEFGYAVDIAQKEKARSIMEKHGMMWYGSGDEVHYTLKGHGRRGEDGGVEAGTTMSTRLQLAGEDIKKVFSGIKPTRVYGRDAKLIESVPKNEKQITQEALERERDIISKNKMPEKPLQTPDLTNVIQAANPQPTSAVLASNDVVSRYMFMMLGQRIDLSSDPLAKLFATA